MAVPGSTIKLQNAYFTLSDQLWKVHDIFIELDRLPKLNVEREAKLLCDLAGIRLQIQQRFRQLVEECGSDTPTNIQTTLQATLKKLDSRLG